MQRDGRGNPGRYVPKHLPRLRLGDLLRRRKMSLQQMLVEHGITAYETLVIRCQRMGVLAPTEDEFRRVVPSPVNSAQEGVVVLEPPSVVDEISGRQIDPEAPVEPPGIVVLTDPQHPFVTRAEEGGDLTDETLVRSSKKLRKKRDDQPLE